MKPAGGQNGRRYLQLNSSKVPDSSGMYLPYKYAIYIHLVNMKEKNVVIFYFKAAFIGFYTQKQAYQNIILSI